MIHTAALKFFVEGIPATKGSHHAFLNRKTGVPIIVPNHNAKMKAWASLVSSLASTYKEETKFPKLTDAIDVTLMFFLPRPQSHFKKDRTVKPSAPRFIKTKPDIDKLARCVLDALTGILWVDDSQVISLELYKYYEGHPFVTGEHNSILGKMEKTGVIIEVEEVI